MVTEKSITEAYNFLRENKNTIPDETLFFIKSAAMKELDRINKPVEEDCNCPFCSSTKIEKDKMYECKKNGTVMGLNKTNKISVIAAIKIIDND